MLQRGDMALVSHGREVVGVTDRASWVEKVVDEPVHLRGVVLDPLLVKNELANLAVDRCQLFAGLLVHVLALLISEIYN